jgi:ketosteroid isomerase-like protein
MTDLPLTEQTRAVATTWFDALTHGRYEQALACLDADVEWINYKILPGYNDAMPWIGTVRGPAAVVASLQTFTGVCDVETEELVRLAVDGAEAAGVIHEMSRVKATGMAFEIEFVQWLTVRDGKIIRWKSYTDPSPILKAIKGDRA